MAPVTAVIIGSGNRGLMYACYALDFPEKFKACFVSLFHYLSVFAFSFKFCRLCFQDLSCICISDLTKIENTDMIFLADNGSSLAFVIGYLHVCVMLMYFG